MQCNAKKALRDASAYFNVRSVPLYSSRVFERGLAVALVATVSSTPSRDRALAYEIERALRAVAMAAWQRFELEFVAARREQEQRTSSTSRVKTAYASPFEPSATPQRVLPSRPSLRQRAAFASLLASVIEHASGATLCTYSTAIDSMLPIDRSSAQP